MRTGRQVYAEALPLDDLIPEHRARIEELAARPALPSPWVTLAGGMVEVPSRAWFEWHWRRGKFPALNEGRQRLPVRLRRKVVQRDGYVCGLCGGDVEPDDVHIDHIIPVSHGGPDELDNLQVAHSICNMKKGARL